MIDRVDLELQSVTKAFGATLAVDRVDLKIQGGSVHALVGENGAGKSTLAKVAAGVHAPDEGSLVLNGNPVEFRSPGDALAHGITMIAQELSLIPTRSVIENVYLGVEDRRGPLLDRRRMARRYSDLIASTGFDIPPGAPVGSLSVARQQEVEILRALARNARLIVMDEPTSRLSLTEARSLHAIVRSLVDRGTGVVFVSHHLQEVLDLSDTVTVLRDGRQVKTSASESETADSLIVSMVGRTLSATFPDRPAPTSESAAVLRVEGLSRAGSFQNVSFVVRAGEIVGLAGLVGAGRTEVVRAIFGVDDRDAGRVFVSDAEMPPDPTQMMAAGVAMIPESRKTEGLLLGRSVRENMSVRHLKRFSRFGIVKRREETAAVTAMADELEIRHASIEQPVLALSGGNQQKALFGRWLLERPTVLIADEPTSGIDVGAKRAIYDLLADLAAHGVGVLLISSELEELLGLADRIVVMRRGAVVDEFRGGNVTDRELIEAAFGAGGAQEAA